MFRSSVPSVGSAWLRNLWEFVGEWGNADDDLSSPRTNPCPDSESDVVKFPIWPPATVKLEILDGLRPLRATRQVDPCQAMEKGQSSNSTPDYISKIQPHSLPLVHLVISHGKYSIHRISLSSQADQNNADCQAIVSFRKDRSLLFRLSVVE